MDQKAAVYRIKVWPFLVNITRLISFCFHDIHHLAFVYQKLHGGVYQAFTSYNNSKGNADTERFMRTLKEELVWINEWKTPTSFLKALDDWIEQYNSSYLRSSLGHMPPNTFEQNYRKNMTTHTLLKSAC